MALVDDLRKDFKKLINSGRLAHSYVLFGFGRHSLGDGGADEKFIFAKELANYLESGKFESADRLLSDARIIDAVKENGIDMIRAAGQFLWQKPAVSSKRTLIIDKAENLTLQAQNAILKISEEPPKHALIFLLAKHPETLLPAVRSRFQQIYVHANSKFQIPNSKQNPKFQIPNREQLKEIVEDKQKMEEFVAGLIIDLSRDKLKNWRAIKELLHRWSMINQFNVNKRLQLEAALTQIHK